MDRDPPVLSLAELAQLGRSVADAELDRRRALVQPQQPATLVYTSGTTGRPKGVVLSHLTFVTQVDACRQAMDVRSDDNLLLFLPLAHIFAKVVYVVCLALRAEMCIPQSMATLVQDLQEAAPTCMPAVPRVFEKLHNRIQLDLQHKGPVAQKVFAWAMGVGRAVSALRQQGKQPGGTLALQHQLAHKLVFAKVHARFGGRIRGFISGGAPLSKDLAEFFAAMDLLILEGYGMTENCAAATVNRLESYKFGTVGRALPGVDIKIAPDGEVLLRGAIVMQGYWHNPEATAEALQDGWLHTGDIGELDGDGFLRITDRKKDLIVTAGGKNVAPQNIESLLKGSPYVSQAMVYGDRRKFLTALLTLEPDAVTSWAKGKGLAFASLAELSQNAEVYRLLQAEVDRLNRSLASYETIKKFAILERDFTVEDGEMTPSLKVRRKDVTRKYQSLLDSFYTEHY
jgi:long-chain acyl-CoA synthetase